MELLMQEEGIPIEGTIPLNVDDSHLYPIISSPTHLISHNLPDFDVDNTTLPSSQLPDLASSSTLISSPDPVYDQCYFPGDGNDRLYVFHSPNGTKYWYPIVPAERRLVLGSVYTNFDEAYSMYQSYAEHAGFTIRKGQTKRWKKIVTHKYLRCNKAGMPQSKRKFDTMCEDSLKTRRRSTFTLTNCKAHIFLNVCQETGAFKLKSFNEYHNHQLVDTYNRDLMKIRRQLPFSTKQFIHQMSLNKIGPVRAHRCMVALNGGHHNVRGTVNDFKNFSKQVRIFIGDRDAQLFIDRLRDRFDNLPGFYFDFTVSEGRLRSVFWADEISKLNYQAFGDVLSFDATYQTNQYNMIFVPFTGVDNHKLCVTFGAGLLFNETFESYQWLLEAFLKCHAKQPSLVLTDQDPSMRLAIEKVLTESRHRLCMWHIMKKLHFKISGELLKNTNLRASIHRLVWNMYIKPSTFETRWKALMVRFGLHSHTWLNDMYAIKERWIPAYFREIEMCCLMKTTSRCESSNSAFKVNSSGANTLVQFLLAFDCRIDGQRYSSRTAAYKTSSATFPHSTGLEIERHAFSLYTYTIFEEVQKELLKGKPWCYVTSREQVTPLIEVFSVNHLDRRNTVINSFKVTYNPQDQSASCSCRCFTRIGYLCRHIFCVYRMLSVDHIPYRYISDRWRKDVLPHRVFAVENRYAVDTSPSTVMRLEILDLANECVDFVRNDDVALSLLLQKMKEIKSEIVQPLSMNSNGNSVVEEVVEEFFGEPIDVDITVNNPSVSRNKGTGRAHRIVGQLEKISAKPHKVPRLCHTCNLYVTKHDSRNCPKKIKAPVEVDACGHPVIVDATAPTVEADGTGFFEHVVAPPT